MCPQNCFVSSACVKSVIPDRVTAQTPIIPDHGLLRVIGRGAYGEIWLPRTVPVPPPSPKSVHPSTLHSQPPFLQQLQSQSAADPISLAHVEFIKILRIGRTAKYH